MDRLLSLACMLVATILWIAGLNTGSVLFYASAGAFELVFRKRLPACRA